MGPVAVAALGAGAFVTTAAAGVVLLRKKILGRGVEVDVEKGLEENIMERREGTGPGWKEYTEVDEKASPGLLEPLIGAFQSQKESDVADANVSRATPTPEPRLPTLNQCPELPALNVQPKAKLTLVLEGDISESHDWDNAPAFPPGLPVPARAVAVVRPIPARLNPLSELGPLDTRITSWPVLAPTPVEEMRTRASGQGERMESDTKNDVVPQDQPSAPSPKSYEPEIPPLDPGPHASSELIDNSDEVDPFADPPDSVHSPRSEISLDLETGASPAFTPRSAATSMDDSDSQLDELDQLEALDSISAPPIPYSSSDVVMPDAILAANIPLPESPPMSPKVVSPLLVHALPLDADVTTAIVFGEELSPSVDVSDEEFSSPIIASPSVPVLAPIVTISYVDEGPNEALRSPLSDTGSSSGSDSSGPETPDGLKQDFPFSPALELSSKDTPRLQLPSCLPAEEGEGIDEDVEVIDDFVMVGQQAPDPPSPTIDITPPEWVTSKLPGSFEAISEPTSDHTSPEPKLTGPIAVVDVPPLTADMVHLCHALLAVSNCAGLVAQAIVGFSVWWTLTLVPA